RAHPCNARGSIRLQLDTPDHSIIFHSDFKQILLVPPVSREAWRRTPCSRRIRRLRLAKNSRTQWPPCHRTSRSNPCEHRYRVRRVPVSGTLASLHAASSQQALV